MDHLPITTNCSLGSFVHYMRLYLKVGKLSQEQETRLKEIGFEIVNNGISGEAGRDRNLLTGDSPRAGNNLGKLAATTLLEAVAKR